MVFSHVVRLAFVTSLIFVSLSAKSGNVPDRILNLPITLENGYITSLKDYAYKQPVYLKFWATWCQPCMAQMPHFQKIQQEYGNKLKVIAINIDLNESEQAIEQVREKFGLTMAMAIDKDKLLSNNMKLMGTPYHLLFDKQMSLVHVGHEADATLDNKIEMVVTDSPLQALNQQTFATDQPSLSLALDDDSYHVLFFTATWCDWYLKETRPTYAKQCAMAQSLANIAAKKYPQIKWHGLLSNLWTDDKDLVEYERKYAIPYTNHIDYSNALFLTYQIEHLPTLVVVKDGKEVSRLDNMTEESLQKVLRALVN